MELIYKRPYDPVDGLLRWRPNQARSYPNNWPDEIDVDVLLDAAYVESGVPKHLLVTWAKPRMQYADDKYNCHSCAPLIGLVLFSRQDDSWNVDASDLQFGYYGEWGRPPDISLQPLGSTHHGLIEHLSFGAQGTVEESVVLIAPNGGEFVKMFDAAIAESWSEDFCSGNVRADLIDDCVAYDGDLDFVPNLQSDYYDLLLTKRVYRSLSKNAPVGTTVTRYRFKGSRYLPQN